MDAASSDPAASRLSIWRKQPSPRQRQSAPPCYLTPAEYDHGPNSMLKKCSQERHFECPEKWAHYNPLIHAGSRGMPDRFYRKEIAQSIFTDIVVYTRIISV